MDKQRRKNLVTRSKAELGQRVSLHKTEGGSQSTPKREAVNIGLKSGMTLYVFTEVTQSNWEKKPEKVSC